MIVPVFVPHYCIRDERDILSSIIVLAAFWIGWRLVRKSHRIL